MGIQSDPHQWSTGSCTTRAGSCSRSKMRRKSPTFSAVSGGQLQGKMLLLGVTTLLLLRPSQVSAEQHFVTEPEETTVIQGQAAILKCVVEDLTGELQWVKDGYGMGYERSLPGYPRYTVTGSSALGENNLIITKTNLEDDADFSCQVGPRPGHQAIQATAHLHVQVPPQVPEVVNHANGTQVEVPHEQEAINITCIAKDGKPPAELKWFKDGTEIVENIWYSVQESDSKLKTAESTIQVKTDRWDNGALYTCRATNPASEGTTLETIVELSVMHPPKPPKILGYEPGQVVTTGQTLHLRCIVKGGNPAPRVHWYKNGKELDLSYTTGPESAENDLYMTVQPNDNNAIYKCEAKNRVTVTPLTAEVQLIVQFGPDKMTITGNQHAKVGETITLMCESGISNPAAKITWSALGQTIKTDTHEVIASPDGGFKTVSNITVELTKKRTDMVLYTCYGSNERLAKTANNSITLSIMYPPDQPVISGYQEGKEIEAESVLSMVCQVHGGNPLAKVTWWKGDKVIESVTHTYQKIVSSRIAITLFREDNLAEYRCNASNPATDEPLIETVTLSVNYPPTKLNITTRPPKPRAGKPLTVVCSSDASNPKSELSWWKDGEPVTGHAIRHQTQNADYGGIATTSELDVTATSADDAQIYECRAMNKLLEKAVNDAIKLDVIYKPTFGATAPASLRIVEHQSGLLNLTATANPAGITYTWYKGDEKLTHEATKSKRDIHVPHFVIDGPILNITNITREDADMYTIEASNSEGSTNFTVKLDVQYPAEITKVTPSVNVDHNSIATLECYFIGNPLPTSVTWLRAGYNMSRPVQEFADGLAKLIVHNVTKEDSGTFTCQVTNGIKEVTATKDAKLVVKYAPEINKSPRYSKAAARNMETGALTCKAEGAPAVTFKWFRNNKVLDVAGIRYDADTETDFVVQYTSTLKIFNVTKEDYGTYLCKAFNDLGSDEHPVHLDDTSEPEPPYDVRKEDSTHNSVRLKWTPGFNGGAPQSFHVRYRRVGTEGYKTEEVVPKNATDYVITGLSRGTEYEFSVKGMNVFGSSTYSDAVKERTAVSALVQDDNIPLIIILTVSIFGMLLLGLNILLILFFYRRRKKKLEKDASEGASNANTVEMFSAPTITEDSKSYTTYDRSLDDFHDDYRVYDPEDELKRFLPPPNYSFYRPPSSNLYGPPPTHGSVPHLGPSPYGPSPAFDQPRTLGVGPPPWDNRKYDTYGSMPRVPPGSPQADREEYANQLRALTKGITNSTSTLPRGTDVQRPMGRNDQGPASLPQPTRPPPPLPPTRSSSNLAVDPHHTSRSSMPPLPSRNYDQEDVPSSAAPPPVRYGPPPPQAYQPTPTSRPGSRPSSRPASRPQSRPQSQHYDYETPPPLYQAMTPPRQTTPPHYQTPPSLSHSQTHLRGEFV